MNGCSSVGENITSAAKQDVIFFYKNILMLAVGIIADLLDICQHFLHKEELFLIVCWQKQGGRVFMATNL